MRPPVLVWWKCTIWIKTPTSSAHLMKKTSTTSQSGFFSSRLLVAVLLCAGVCCLVAAGTSLGKAAKAASLHSEASANAFQRTLSFEERVSYQRAIEDVRTQRTVFKHFLRTTPAKTTRQTVMVRSLAIRPATTTRPTAFKRSLAIPSA
jgi:hypothetical protein